MRANSTFGVSPHTLFAGHIRFGCHGPKTSQGCYTIAAVDICVDTTRYSRASHGFIDAHTFTDYFAKEKIQSFLEARKSVSTADERVLDALVKNFKFKPKIMLAN
ncbi:hypothetical protein HHI36_009700 [Cryptolaemus montrouzieri]|uniref:Uncharacterized protein n=1 Tax=Cryptolaemus montrouzieri TaxID=559131 RepID=A0ABD2MHA1_9CUCU